MTDPTTQLDRLAEMGRPVEKGRHYYRLADANPTNALDQRALAALAERIASELELAEENERLTWILGQAIHLYSSGARPDWWEDPSRQTVSWVIADLASRWMARDNT